MSRITIENFAGAARRPRRWLRLMTMLNASCGISLTLCSVGAAQEAEPSAGATLEEVVVTAQKKSESAQRAPVEISVVTADELVSRGVDDPRAFENLVPSAKFGLEGNVTQLFMRGVGSQVDVPWVPEAVALQFDGITLPRYASSIGLYDLQRVEVLPGPQGTLYGSSSIGGIVNVLTNRPSSDAFVSDALLEFGDYAQKRATVVENVPITADWSMRAAVNAEFRDGYANNGSDNKNAIAARLSSLYVSRDNGLSLYLTGNYYQNHYENSPSQWFPYPNGRPYDFPPNASQTAFFYPPDGYPLNDARNTVQIYQLGAQMDWDLGPMTVSYVPGFLRSDTFGLGSDSRVIAGFPEPERIGLDQFSNELRLTNSRPGPFTWLAGLFQSYDKSPGYDLFGPNLGGFDVTSYARDYATFAQGTYALASGTRLTLGGRYSRDELAASHGVAFYPIPPTFSQGTAPIIYNQSWNRFDWKVGAEQDLTANSMLYANVQTGFNPGTFQANLPDPSEPIQPQKMLGYTLGVKNLLFDARLKVNVEGFFYNYKDQIIQSFDLATGGSYLFNAPHSQIKGAQVDAAFAVTRTFKLYANVGYLDAQFREFTAPIVGGAIANLEGYQLPFAPTASGALGAEETVSLGGHGSLVLRVDSYLSSSYWESFSHTSGLNQPGYTKTDVNFTYHSPDDSWDIGLWGKNLENTAVATAGGQTGNPPPNAAAVFVEPPRTFGVRLHWRFTKEHAYVHSNN
jgi:iron complex outermembrane receptor protein